MDDPRFGAPFINRLVADPNLKELDPALAFAARPGDPHAADDIVRKAIRVNLNPGPDPAAEILDGIGVMNARLLDTDFWNRKWDTPNRHDADSKHEYFHFYRATMTRQPGVDGEWWRPSWECIPQQLGNHFVPLTITAKAGRRVVTCEFRPVPDALRATIFRACLVAFNRNKEPRYSRVWNAGSNSLTLADDEDAVYLAVIAMPRVHNAAYTHVDLTGDRVAMMPYRARFTGAQPRVFKRPVPESGISRHPHGGGIVANTATVDATVWVATGAMVLGNAKVHGQARIEDFALVDGDAVIGRPGQADDPVVSGHAWITDKAQVFGHARIRDHAWVGGEAKIYENALVNAHSVLRNCEVFGTAAVCQMQVRDPGLAITGKFGGSAIRGGDVSSTNGEDHKGTWLEFPKISTEDNRYQWVGLRFEKTSAVFAMDEHGMNHGYRLNEPQVVADTVNGVETRVLALDGRSQAIELKPDAVDFPDLTVAAWIKWDGGEPNQMLWHFGDGMKKMMGLTPKSSGGKLRFAISDGTTHQVLDAPAALPAGRWTHIAVSLGGDTGTLYIDGRKVAANERMNLNPDRLHAPLSANANYLGRADQSGWFAGRVDEFRIFRKVLGPDEVAALAKDIAPSAAPVREPDTAPPVASSAWLAPPAADGLAITMSAREASDPNGVLYYFRSIDDPSRDSGWISEPRFTDCLAPAGKTSRYTVRVRDLLGNTAAESPSAAATPAAAMPLPPPAFAVAPRGDSPTSSTMRAAKPAATRGLIQFRFTRAGTPPASSGWSSSPTWTDSGLQSGAEYSYTLERMDEAGRIETTGGPLTAVARDDTPPTMEALIHAQWEGEARVLLDRRIRMSAHQAPTVNDRKVDYYYECVEKPAINSGWVGSREWISAPLANGNWSFRHKLRDRSPQHNESPWSLPSRVDVLPTNCYQDHRLAELTKLPDSTLVRFTGKVTRMLPDAWEVSSSDHSIQVVSRAFDRIPDATLLGREVRVEGHLWTYDGHPKKVTYATVLPVKLGGRLEFENALVCGETWHAHRPDASAQEFVGLRSPERETWIEFRDFAPAQRIEITGRSIFPVKVVVNGKPAAEVDLPCGDNDPFVTKELDLDIPDGATLRFVANPNGGLAFLDSLFVGETFPVSGRVADAPAMKSTPKALRRVFFAPTPDTLQRPSYVAFVQPDGSFRRNLPPGDWHAIAVTDDPVRVKQSQPRAIRVSGAVTGLDLPLKVLPAAGGKIEGEDGLLVGPYASRGASPKASGGMEVANLWGENGGVEFLNVAAARRLTVRFSSNSNARQTYSLYINGGFSRKIEFTGTGTWDKYAEAKAEVDIPEHAALRFQRDAGDGVWNIDFIILEK